MTPKLSIEDRLEATQISLNVICANLDILWVYVGKINQELFPLPVLNAFGHFIVFDREAHMRAIIVGLNSLFDKRRDVITLRSLIADASLKECQSKAMLKLVERLGPRTEKVKIIRDNLYAHRNNAAVHNNVFAQAGLSRNDLETIVRLTIRIFNAIASEVGARPYNRVHLARDELVMLLKAGKEQWSS